MTQSITSTSPVNSDLYFLVGDLFPEQFAGDTRLVRVSHYYGNEWTVSLDDTYGRRTVCSSDEPSLPQIRNEVRCLFSCSEFCRHTTPRRVSYHNGQRYTVGESDATATVAIPAAKLAKKIIARRPMMAGELLEQPTFLAAARKAAEAGKTFTHELLGWERKDVVMEAVAVVRQKVETERALALEESRRLAATAAEKARREQPTRDAVTAAYRSCGYRTCRQGHDLAIRIGGSPSATSDVSKGDSYSSRCTWRKQESTHTLTVREDWLTTVASRGLKTFDGGLVLSADHVGHTADLTAEALELLVVRQGRGTSLETERIQVIEDAGKWRKVRRGDAVTIYSNSRIARDACIDAGLVAQ